MRSERVLVSMKNYIGDAVMTEPMISAVELAFARVEIQAASPVDEVLWRPGDPRKFFSTPRPRRVWDHVVQARTLREKSYDVAILVNRSFRSALAARLAGIKVRVGHNTEGRGPLLTRKVSYDSSRFEALSQLELAALAGVDASLRMPCLSTTVEEKRRGRELAECATVGIQAGARWLGKQLPLRVTTELVKSLTLAGEKVVLLGGSDEVEPAGQVVEAVGGGVVNLTGRTTVRETLGVLSSLRGIVGSDTGLMHLAAGVGCATVTVFGPTSQAKWGHNYPPHRVLTAPDRDMSRVEPAEVLSNLQGILY